MIKIKKRNNYRYIWLLLGWVFYLLMYMVTERVIDEKSCHIIHCVVDDWIPFNEFFVLGYISWFGLLVFSLAYFFFFDVESFVNAEIFLIITQVTAIIIYFVYPSVQYLRPESFERSNIFTLILGEIYSVDTPTGVCPSMHVAFSIALLLAWIKKKDASKGMKIFISLLVVFICISVLFVKQHSFVDVLAAIPVCLLAALVTYGKRFNIQAYFA